MKTKIKLYLQLIWYKFLAALPFNIGDVDLLDLIDIKQQISVSAFVEAAESLKNVMSLYVERAGQYAKAAEDQREQAKQLEKAAEQSDQLSKISNEKAVKTRKELEQLQKLID